jgi:hypothetical protein
MKWNATTAQKFLAEFDEAIEEITFISDNEMEALIEKYVRKAAQVIIRRKKKITRIFRNYMSFCSNLVHATVPWLVKVLPLCESFMREYTTTLQEIADEITSDEE